MLAATLHDIGWRAWEAAPRIDPETGRPMNFLRVDIDQHLEFYEAGIGEVTARDRYAGHARRQAPRGHLPHALRHAGRAHAWQRAPDAQAKIDEFVSRIEARFLALQHELGVSDEEFWRNYVLLQVFDRLSLWLCKGDPSGTGAMQIALPDGGELARRRRPRAAARSARIRSRPTRARSPVPVRVVPLTARRTTPTVASSVLAAHVEHRVYRLTRGEPTRSGSDPIVHASKPCQLGRPRARRRLTPLIRPCCSPT